MVKQNRTYDQVLGDDRRGDGEPGLTLFGEPITPNIHALVKRWPLLDRMFADSDASPDRHQWTTGATITPYASGSGRRPTRGGGGRSTSTSTRSPGREAASSSTRSSAAGISWANLGEARTGVIAHADRDRPAGSTTLVRAKAAALRPGAPPGCFPNNIAHLLGEAEVRPMCDSSPPPAPRCGRSRA